MHEGAPAGTGWWEARRRAHRVAAPLGVTRVPLAAAAGLVLAEGVTARAPMPAFDTAAMDGYAVAGPGPWRLCGRVRAGEEPRTRLRAGEAVEISTGAQVPPGADAVLRVESARRDGGLVRGPVPDPGTHIRPTGEDAAAGALLAPAGVRVGPAMLGLAASCGHDTLAVRPRPCVTVLVTGDELVRFGPGGAGRVRDALGPMLPSLVEQLGGSPAAPRYVDDTPGSLTAAVSAAGAESEVVVVTGSTSVGTTDQLRRLLADRGARPVVDTVACRPGHPQLLAPLGDQRWIVGLPGNPFAALVAVHTLLGPLLDGLTGRRLPTLGTAVVTGEVRSAHGVTRLVPVAWDDDGASVVAGHRSAFLRGVALADALAVLDPGWTSGSTARVLPL
ncbi:molybdopterin molybdotransferase MoeA [Pseudonocardia sp. RS11V-5]|uniref:molybdopterin molybdotransferase MoeA n=1 Tax=Pseudonocardia terrae TaxID=2905831 RepID=UPI001E284510|nr:molybdopterin molybdotransferase MoeA [Pseudonocardia terrae]MCE3551380.1 molybdopterin molybdotransferase MoeA [Pseudonocardia terrae]